MKNKLSQFIRFFGIVAVSSSLYAAPPVLINRGSAPEFIGISNWINSPALSMQKLRGKVVLVDFWTYSCINCLRTLPYLNRWHQQYNNQGLVIIGVHTPEFKYEHATDGLKTAMRRFGIQYTVAQDNQYLTWKAYNNQYWPATYLIDKQGRIRYQHFGEGAYKETEQAIKQLLVQP